MITINKKILFPLTVLLSVLVLPVTSFAQNHNASVAMGDGILLQKLNPSEVLDGSFLTIPIIGNLDISMGIPISPKDMFHSKEGDNYVNSEVLANALNENATHFNLDMSVLAFGFKIKERHSIALDFNVRATGNMMFPGDVLSFITSNELINQKSYDLNLGLDMMAWGEVGVNYAFNVWDNLNVGVRVKYIAGLLYAGSNSNAELILQDDRSYDIRADVDMLVSGSENGDMDLGVNHGFGIDFGASYDFDFGLSVGFSVRDLGFINWDTGVTQYISKDPSKSYSFNGIGDLGSSGSEDGSDDVVGDLMDDIIETVELDTIYNASVRTVLPTTLNFYGSYAIDKSQRHNVSLNFMTKFYNKDAIKTDVATTIGYTYKNLNDSFRAVGAYTYSTLTDSNFTLALVANSRKTQFFIAADFNPGVMSSALNIRGAGLRLGLTFLLGNVANNGFRRAID